MTFAGILEIHKPFLRGASQHPKEALFQNGLSIFNMGTIYVNISLVHLADHLIYLYSSSSFWFSLNSSYDNEFHLSKDLGITPLNYYFLLVAADLAHFNKRWVFSIKMMKLKLFLEGHLFTTISCDGTLEVNEKKVDLNAFMKGEPPKHRERVYSRHPLDATPYCPLIMIGTTTARRSRATGSTTTATGSTMIATGGMVTARGSRATGGMTTSTGGTTMAWDSRATGGTTTVTVGTAMARGSRVTGSMTTGSTSTARGSRVTGSMNVVTVCMMMARGSRATGNDDGEVRHDNGD